MAFPKGKFAKKIGFNKEKQGKLGNKKITAHRIRLIKIRLISGTISGTGGSVRQIALSGYLLPRRAGANNKAERGADSSE